MIPVGSTFSQICGDLKLFCVGCQKHPCGFGEVRPFLDCFRRLKNSLDRFERHDSAVQELRAAIDGLNCRLFEACGTTDAISCANIGVLTNTDLYTSRPLKVHLKLSG